jgi:hypothetical protein
VSQSSFAKPFGAYLCFYLSGAIARTHKCRSLRQISTLGGPMNDLLEPEHQGLFPKRRSICLLVLK